MTATDWTLLQRCRSSRCAARRCQRGPSHRSWPDGSGTRGGADRKADERRWCRTRHSRGGCLPASALLLTRAAGHVALANRQCRRAFPIGNEVILHRASSSDGTGADGFSRNCGGAGERRSLLVGRLRHRRRPFAIESCLHHLGLARSILALVARSIVGGDSRDQTKDSAWRKCHSGSVMA
jgi:hypothetical protein